MTTPDVTPPQERSKAMGLIGAAFGLGFVVGPAIGGVLIHPAHNLHYVDGSDGGWDDVMPLALIGSRNVLEISVRDGSAAEVLGLGRADDVEHAVGPDPLDGQERDLIALKFAGGLSNGEIARVLRMSESNVGTRLHRTITKLREACHD